MQFGLHNVAQSFERYIDSVLRTSDLVFMYTDDLLVTFRDKKEHPERFEIFIQ